MTKLTALHPARRHRSFPRNEKSVLPTRITTIANIGRTVKSRRMAIIVARFSDVKPSEKLSGRNLGRKYLASFDR
jgi:hypothetical protein